MATRVTHRYLSGRPAYYADLPSTETDRTLKLLDSFYKITSRLRYQEIIGLARSLNVSYSTVLRWKYRLSKPNFEVMMLIIEWGKAGKPLSLRRREVNLASLL